MKRTAAERWEETNRREVGVATGQSRDAGAYFAIVYAVTECRKVRGEVVEWRERLVHGATLYQAPCGFIGTAALLEVVAKGVKALSSIAYADDERVSTAKRATSRRKRR